MPTIQIKNSKSPAITPEICPIKLMPGKKDHKIPMPAIRVSGRVNIKFFLISHFRKINLFFPNIVAIKIKATTP